MRIFWCEIFLPAPVPMQMIVRLIGTVCMIHHKPLEINTPQEAAENNNPQCRQQMQAQMVITRRES